MYLNVKQVTRINENFIHRLKLIIHQISNLFTAYTIIIFIFIFVLRFFRNVMIRV